MTAPVTASKANNAKSALRARALAPNDRPAVTSGPTPGAASGPVPSAGSSAGPGTGNPAQTAHATTQASAGKAMPSSAPPVA